jgi:hypothetical protein
MDLFFAIYDIQGRLIKKESTSGAISKTLNVTDTPSGSYLILFFDNNGIIAYRQKFVKLGN